LRTHRANWQRLAPHSFAISESLTDNPAECARGPLRVVNAERDPLIVPKIELGQIPFQVLLADVVIHAIDAALEDRKVTLNRIRVRIAANIFADGVNDRRDTRERQKWAALHIAGGSAKYDIANRSARPRTKFNGASYSLAGICAA
jgi:hypothetical protein